MRTVLPDNFMSVFGGLIGLDIRYLVNIETIGNGCLVDCDSLTRFDLSALRNLYAIGEGFMAGCSEVKVLDLRGLYALYSIGYFSFTMLNRLDTIFIGDVDWSHKVVGDSCFEGAGYYNGSMGTIYADTVELGNKFKEKFPNLSNWFVEVM